MKVIIVIPTYKEEDNIGRLLDVLDSTFKEMPDHRFEVLVVDANSPDRTGEIVEEKSKVHDWVHLLVEKKKSGLGAAYVQAFKYAMEELSPDVLIEMDADFQHDPKYVNDMVKEIEKGADYVVASRFVKGGGIPEDWAFYRKFLSFGGNLFSKVVLGIYNINDFTSGFKASRVKGFVDRLDLDSVRSAGFAYKIDLLYKMHKLGANIVEIPFRFGLRDRGDSKMERNNAMDSLKVVISIRINENESFFKFAVVGVAGLIVDTGIFNILRALSVFSPSNSALVSGSIAMLTTFYLNNHWSFGDRKLESNKKKAIGIVVYFISSSIPILVRSKIVELFVMWFGNTFIISNIAFFMGIVFGLIWNFTVYSRIIWRKKKA